jgi:hypothetical protein
MEDEPKKWHLCRYMRIASSASCTIVCVILVVLWVRSYWIRDEMLFRLVSSFGNTIVFDRGRIEFLAEPIDPEDANYPWPPSNENGQLITIYTDEAYDSGWEIEELPPWNWHNVGFDAFIYPMGVRLVSIPFWFVTLVCVVAGSLPWIRWKFSLRILLIGLTLVAAALGIFAAGGIPTPFRQTIY